MVDSKASSPSSPPPPLSHGAPQPPADAGQAAPVAKPLPAAPARKPEIGGPKGPEPTRYGDWEKGGRCIDF
jgi:hypothetical protein